MRNKEIVFINDKFLPAKEAKISVFEPGFLYGFGLFETMRAYNNHIVYLEAHLKRLKGSCALIKIPFFYSRDRLKKAVKETVKINNLKDAYVRLTLWRAEYASGILITAKKYTPYPKQKYHQGIHACISRLRQNENYFFANLKTTSRLFYQLAYSEAKKKKMDEAIILNNRGYVAEVSRSNIFLAKDNQIFTPALACGCLDGVTRKVVFSLAKKYNIKAYEANLSVQDFYAAEEAFLTNSLIGIMPLVSIEGKKIGNGLAGRITKFFMQKYNELLKC